MLLVIELKGSFCDNLILGVHEGEKLHQKFQLVKLSEPLDANISHSYVLSCDVLYYSHQQPKHFDRGVRGFN